MSHSAITINNVTKRFDDFIALKKICLEVKKGELVCFLGPSGCGKTTLLRIIAGLEECDDGEIIQHGKVITHLPPSKRDYGIVFQSYALFPNLTVAKNIAYGLKKKDFEKKEAKKRVKELLALVGLSGSEEKYPSELSGGQQQRVAFARAIATNPALLLLDEPLSALDARVRERLRQEIRELQKNLGITTIMVTHDQEEALSIADKIVVMNQGVIEQVGTPLEIYHQPKSLFVADFVGKINLLKAFYSRNGYFQVGQLRFKVALQAKNEPQAEEAIKLLIRPEDIKLYDDTRNDEGNILEGDVLKVTFLGSFCRVLMRIRGLLEDTLLLDLPHKALVKGVIQEGSFLKLCIASGDIFYFRDEENA
ncbi:putative 2-aminoethylphosphonate ABC transporter ATP-binding protein [Sulfurospirillum barnesii]|uniref:Putative 2-aminoethylphosphonate ABC transporter, ATP-binding protein n=1 Tax=Sulfurospirillum barnesii (strain ATCC 700032 / DSM 10660 / SES-3) TaxID=760154 RepID=I3XZ80_SULBS|nr:putative 2-aminoethylphosphonate ABC transporter ATP-binding protein [Sulfurospirillum barnesii]AFL69254.1 putative 2-aminoethylphosphonate ABC transporter, ATP-binding protein [Sulfurospirillum barnesii SES-3]